MDCGDLIAICRVSPGGVLWVLMTSSSSMLVSDHCVRNGAAFNIWWFMNAKLYTCLREICRQCYEYNNLAYSTILRLKIINDKSIEAIELSNIRRDIWGKVALSEIILCTYFGRGDVVQQPPISRSNRGYWAHRIHISEWSDRYGYIYMFIIPRAGAGDYRWNLIFLFIFISHSQHCLKICVPCC